MKYILVIQSRRKRAKRHIVKRSDDMNALENLAKNNINSGYKKTIFTGNWKFVKEVES